MKKLTRLLWLPLLVASLFASCSDSDNNEPYIPPPAVTQDTVSSTVLVYMIGQNDLSEFLEANIRTMLTGMSDAPYGGNWLVYLDNSTNPELYHLEKGEDGTVRKRVVRQYNDQYSTDVNVMRDVINEAFALFPADNYGLILSSHANGWFPAYNTIQKRSFGEEKVGGWSFNMNIWDMAEALAEVPHLNYVLFDACLMSCIEVAYEFRHIADYLIASPASVISWGFPYNKIVSHLLKMTETDYVRVLDQYYQEYKNYFGTLSVVDLREMDHLAHAFQALMSTESAVSRANSISRSGMQDYEPGYPIYDFGQLVDSLGVGQAEITSLVHEAISKAVLHAVYTEFSTVDYWTQVIYNQIYHCSGLTSYIPERTETNYLYNYKKLEWFEASGWNFTQWFK